MVQRDVLRDRRGEHERLEGRPGLEAVRVAVLLRDHVVEEGLAGLDVNAHRSRLGDGLDVATAGLDLRQPADGLVRGVHVGRHRPVGCPLEAHVDGGVDGQPAGVEELPALLGGCAQLLVLQQIVEDVVTEERRARVDAAVLGLPDVQAQWLRLGLVGLGLRDHVELGHPVDHHVAAIDCPVPIVRRVVAGGVLHQAGQHGGLPEVQPRGVLVEVVPRGTLYTEGAVAEVGDVEVPLQDPVLGVLVLERDCVAQLAQLALVGVVGGGLLLFGCVGLLQEGQLDHLLGDRRTALDDAVAGLVGDQRAQGALEVEGAVPVEAVVLDRDDRLDHGPGDVLELDVDPVLVVQRGDQPAVAVEDPGLLGQRLGLELCGQVVETVGHVAGADAQDTRQGDGQPGRDHAHHDRHGAHDGEVGKHA